MNNPLIVALDVDNATEARRLVSQLESTVDFYKIGMELYAAEGMSFVKEVLDKNKRVFLDLKLYDISETVKRATKQIAKTGVTFLTVHGSLSVLRAATEGRSDSDLKLLGVTVLTSFDQQDLTDLGFPCEVENLVALRARNAMASGLDGLICSAMEVGAVRTITGPKSILITPGVRSLQASTGDQKRVTTPSEAILNGADYVVVGREVTRAKDPRADAERILNDIRQHLAARDEGGKHATITAGQAPEHPTTVPSGI